MKLVRKVSRRRYGRAVYEHERFMVPIPAKAREIVRPWVGHDMEVHVEPFGEGFAVLVYPEERWIGLWRISSRFSFLVKQLEKDMGLRGHNR